MVEITASDQATSRGPTLRSLQPVSPSRPPAAPTAAPTFEPAVFTRASTVVGGPLDPARDPAREAAPRAASRLAVKVDLAPESDTAAATLREELTAIKRLVGQVLEVARRPATTAEKLDAEQSGGLAPLLASGGLSGPLFALDQRLLDEGLDAAAREAVITSLRTSLAASLAHPGSPALAHAAVGALSRLIPCLPTEAASPARVVALVGPTGVGKTTTIAKLAAYAKLRRGQRVAMITADTYRIAAVEQLRTYAEILGVPLRVALSPADVHDAMAQLSDADLILIDTAGRSPTDSARLDELRAVLAAARPDRTHLVMAATAGAPVLRRITDRFALLSPNACILTKLDESPTIGQAVATARAASLPISFVTTGQEVPDHLDAAQPEALARRMLGLDS
jgi:signal recognition particle GTPase